MRKRKFVVSLIVFLLAALIMVGFNFLPERETATSFAWAAEGEAKWVSHEDFFDHYMEWPSSSEPLDLDFSRYWLQIYSTGPHLIDVSGDGLVDLVYRSGQTGATNDIGYGIFLNNGANQMVPAYVCFYDGFASEERLWYGNCADSNWTWGS